MNKKTFDHKTIEKKWQKKWQENKTYQPDLTTSNKPFYNLMMFPYPSAEGLHVGNMYAFTGADVYGRFQRMQGYDVFEPIGLDGFGIHSENYAIKIGKHPKEQAKISQENFYRQLSSIGNGYSWDNALETYDPDYYKWTQWLFVQMYKNGLAYRKAAMVNWCPSCKTVLADEQVEAGLCERCGSQVKRREMEQWFFKITDYADRLLENIEKINWPNKIKTAQTQWIGKKEGINITYPIDSSDKSVTCFTTRPDTNYGATFIVLSPETAQEYLDIVPEKHKKQVEKYIDTSLKKTEQQRLKEGRKKSGAFTGLFAINHLTDKKMPIWVADFVLKDVGTGAVVGVPGHDIRDFEFANEYDIEIIRVVVGADGDTSDITDKTQVQEDEGIMTNSGILDGLDIHEATKKIMDYMEEKRWGKRVYNYHLRDWLISRQRYWGPPIPMVKCNSCGWQPVDEKDLPVKLPDLDEWRPKGDGSSPLENAPDNWLYTTCPKCGQRAKRETDVSDTFLDSSWYHFRYPSVNSDTKNTKPFDPSLTKKWLPVNAYIGGAEHAVLHLLYARFVAMALNDWGHIDFDEPYPFLFSHGLIIKDGAKMSKSKGNVVVPDEYIERYGADTLRTYLMFIGPYDGGGDFRDSGIASMRRFLDRVWNIFLDEAKVTDKTTPETAKQFHKTIQSMTEDIKEFKYNTALARFMELLNVWKVKKETLCKKDAREALKLIAPFAPHMTEELYSKLFDSKNSIHHEAWPSFNKSLITDDKVDIVIQVNGKLRSTITISIDESKNQKELIERAKSDDNVKRHVADKQIKKEIFIPGKLINFVL